MPAPVIRAYWTIDDEASPDVSGPAHGQREPASYRPTSYVTEYFPAPAPPKTQTDPY